MNEALQDKVCHWLLTAEALPLLVTDAGGDIVLSNSAAQALFGYSAAELQGLAVEALLPERHRHQHLQARTAYARDPHSRPMNAGRTLQARRRDGSEFAAEIGLNPLGDGLVLTTIQDVTERERAEALLREREARLKQTEEIAHLGSWELDLVNQRLIWSDEVYRMFGLAPQVFGATYAAFLDCVHPDDRAAVDNAYSQSLRDNRDSYEIEHRIVRKDNHQVRVVHEKCQHFRDTGGRIVRSVGMVHDITERKRTEEALLAMQAEMEQVMRFHVANQTVAALAHELNQPLNAVASYAEAALRLLKAGNPKPDKLQHAVERSAQQAQRAGQVVRELLAFLRKGEVQSEPVDLNAIVPRALARIEADSHGAFQTRLELDPALARVNANRLQVEKVLVNLVRNGVEAMHDAGIDERLITVTVQTSSDGNLAQVTVRDSGPGIDAATLHRIFDPFFTTKPRGLGMGLAISRAIIEAHGGQLWVESEPGAGASFHFTLPFAA